MSRVGIVEDDAGNQRALARLLRAAGLHPVTFASAEDYLLAAGDAEIACLVVDVQLGGMSGFELQRRLSASASTPPVVFLTAAEEGEASERAARAGCAYVRKNAPAADLLSAIHDAVASFHPCPKG